MVGRLNRSAGIKDNLSASVSDYGTSRISVSPACQSSKAFGKNLRPGGLVVKGVILRRYQPMSSDVKQGWEGLRALTHVRLFALIAFCSYLICSYT